MKKKLFSILMTVVMFMLVVSTTNPIKAATTDTTVEDITNQDTIHTGANKPVSNITTKGDHITVIYSAASLKIIGAGTDATASQGRPDGYAWLGIRVTAPAGKDIEKYKIKDAVAGTTFDRYFGVNEERLKDAVKNGKDLTFSVTVDWLKADDTKVSTHTIDIIVKADKITLFDKADAKEVWNQELYQKEKEEAENNKPSEEKPEVPDDKKPSEEKPEVPDDKVTQETNTENTPKNEKDKTYKTGSADIILGATIISMISLAGIYFTKK